MSDLIDRAERAPTWLDNRGPPGQRSLPRHTVQCARHNVHFLHCHCSHKRPAIDSRQFSQDIADMADTEKAVSHRSNFTTKTTSH